MKWLGRTGSDNVEDRRGMGGGWVAGGGIGAVVIGVIIYLLGGDPSQVLQQTEQQPVTQQRSAAEDQMAGFVKVVLADTERIWDSLFTASGQTYSKPRLVLFTQSVQSGCGYAGAAMGPFYCPGDSKVYIDLSFADELSNRFGAGGDFAMAYVVAHEVGHHIQNLLGTSDKMDRLRQQLSEAEYNKMSVKLELQADFLAGVWAHYNQRYLEEGDIEEALNAANAIGDDKLQKEAQGYTVPDAFTHGTSAQRMYWFKKGYTTGDITQGNTFGAADL
jgi:predicted metalloprotease